MNTTVLYAELLVVGSGGAISILVFFYSFFGNKSWFSNIQELTTIGGLVSLIPVLSIIYLLGIVINNVGHLLFQLFFSLFTFFGLFKPEVNDNHITKRFPLYNSRLSELIGDFEFRQSKIRICRGWFINALLIAVAFWICMRKDKIDWETAMFFIITAVVLMILTLISWTVTMQTQLDLLTQYKESKNQNQGQG